jgi:hypothetical protein
MEEDGVVAVGRNGGGRGEIVCAAGITGHIAEEFAVGHLRVAGG